MGSPVAALTGASYNQNKAKADEFWLLLTSLDTLPCLGLYQGGGIPCRNPPQKREIGYVQIGSKLREINEIAQIPPGPRRVL